jgi:hypothetical protein
MTGSVQMPTAAAKIIFFMNTFPCGLIGNKGENAIVRGELPPHC